MKTKRKQTSNKLLNLIMWIIVLILPYLCYRSFTLPLQFPDEYSEKLLLICAAAAQLYIADQMQFLPEIDLFYD